MAYVTKLMREKMILDSSYSHQMKSLKNKKDFAIVPFEFQLKATNEYVIFPTYGKIPVESIRWKHKDTNELLPWSCGRFDDIFMIESEYLKD